MNILAIIENWVDDKSKVLDLGCGDGDILVNLKKEKAIRAFGVEIESANIEECIKKGINVIEQNIDMGLSNISSNSFDVVLMSETIQVLRDPKKALEEITRIGETCIVIIPNFAHWRSRLSLLFKGKMPVTNPLPDSWHDTPNIHLCTLKDFNILCRSIGIKIEDTVYVNSNSSTRWYLKIWPNLFCASAVYKISK